jgi:hypothetical protein
MVMPCCTEKRWPGAWGAAEGSPEKIYKITARKRRKGYESGTRTMRRCLRVRTVLHQGFSNRRHQKQEKTPVGCSRGKALGEEHFFLGLGR